WRDESGMKIHVPSAATPTNARKAPMMARLRSKRTRERIKICTLPSAAMVAETPPNAATAERLKTLYARWDQFANEYEAARKRNDQEVMTNLRGLMLLIKKEIRR